MSKYHKTIVAVVGAVIAWSEVVIESPRASVSAGEWRAGAILLATALGVYGVSNVKG